MKKDRTLTIGKDSSTGMKTIAFLMVIIAHYYRFYSIDSKMSILCSIGFFGSAIFAFLSGYGVTKSYNSYGFGKGWLKKN